MCCCACATSWSTFVSPGGCEFILGTGFEGFGLTRSLRIGEAVSEKDKSCKTVGCVALTISVYILDSP